MNFGQEWYSKLFLSVEVLLLYTVYIFFGRKKAIEIQKNRTNEIPLMIGRSWFSFQLIGFNSIKSIH
jgi:hypothetical protein